MRHRYTSRDCENASQIVQVARRSPSVERLMPGRHNSVNNEVLVEPKEAGHDPVDGLE